jgi:hypothetical protein
MFVGFMFRFVVGCQGVIPTLRDQFILYLQQPRGVVENKLTLNDRSVLDVVSTPFLEPMYLVLRYVPFEDGWPQEPHLSK